MISQTWNGFYQDALSTNLTPSQNFHKRKTSSDIKDISDRGG